MNLKVGSAVLMLITMNEQYTYKLFCTSIYQNDGKES